MELRTYSLCFLAGFQFCNYFLLNCIFLHLKNIFNDLHMEYFVIDYLNIKFLTTAIFMLQYLSDFTIAMKIYMHMYICKN